MFYRENIKDYSFNEAEKKEESLKYKTTLTNDLS